MLPVGNIFYLLETNMSQHTKDKLDELSSENRSIVMSEDLDKLNDHITNMLLGFWHTATGLETYDRITEVAEPSFGCLRSQIL